MGRVSCPTGQGPRSSLLSKGALGGDEKSSKSSTFPNRPNGEQTYNARLTVEREQVLLAQAVVSSSRLISSGTPEKRRLLVMVAALVGALVAGLAALLAVAG